MRKAVKYIRLFFAGILVLPMFILLSIVAILLGAILRLLHLKRLGEAVPHAILDAACLWIMGFLGSSVEIIGYENLPKKGEKMCFFPNHSSMIDIPAIYSTGRWPGMVAKKELWRVPVINGLLWLLHCVPLNRKSPKDAIKAIHDGVENIEKGYPMVIFPEGTRSKDGKIGEFKSGSFKMATRAGALIVPVAMKNVRKTLESADRFGIVKIYVEILPPIDSSKLTPDELKDLPLRVENMVREAYDRLPSWPKKKR